MKFHCSRSAQNQLRWSSVSVKLICSVWRMLVLHSSPFSSKNLMMWSGGIHSAPAFTPLWLALCGFDASWRMPVCVWVDWKAEMDITSICLYVVSHTYTHTTHRHQGSAHSSQDVSSASQIPPHTNNSGRKNEREMVGVGVPLHSYISVVAITTRQPLLLTAISLQLPTLKRSASRSVRVNNLDP